MRLDWTLNIGTLLTIVGAMFLFIWRFHVSTVNRLESAIESLETMLRTRTHDMANKFTELHFKLFQQVHELEIRVTRVEEHVKLREPE